MRIWKVKWGHIVKREVERETEKCYYIDGKRWLKDVSDASWHTSYGSAVSRLTAQTLVEINRHKNEILKLEARLEKLNNDDRRTDKGTGVGTSEADIRTD